MKITKTLLKATSIFMLSTALLFSCSDGSDSSGGNTNNPPSNPGNSEKTVSSVVLSSKSLSLGINDEATLTAFVNGTASTEVTWESTDATVASVNGGKVTALKAGNAKITAKSKTDATKAAECSVTVEASSTTSKILYNFDYSTLGNITGGTTANQSFTSETYKDTAVYFLANNTSSSLRFRGPTDENPKNSFNYNNPNTAATGTTVGSTVEASANFYAGIDLSKLNIASPDTVTLSVTFKSFGSSDAAATDTGIFYLVDSSNKAVAVSTGVELKSGCGNKTVAVDVPKNANIKFLLSRNGSSKGGIDITEIKVVDKNSAGENIVRPTSITLNKTSASLKITDSEVAPTATLTATVLPSNVTSGYGTVSWISSDTSVATVANGVVTAVGAGTATLIASTSNGKSVSATVSVADERTVKYILASDTPDGWAGTQSTTGGYGAAAANIYTVTNYKEFTDALKAGSTKKIIYVSGTIDLNGNQSAYDYIKAAGLDSKYSSYEDYRTKFLATCNFDSASSLASDQSKLHNAQAKQAIIAIPSNTTIIGLGTDAGFNGGNLSISNATNVVIRNVKIWDSLDFFPPWYQSEENNFNADMDCITISGSTNVWIDHCTIGDSAHTYDKVKIYNNGANTELDWVNYDALCDVVNGSNYVTISYNKFMNDDKVGLVGNGDKKTSDEGKLKTTFHHNLYDNVGQRLPRVRFGQVHIFNQYYKKVSSYCIGLGLKCQIVSENNYFGGSFNAYSEMSNPRYLTQSGNAFNSSKTTSPSVSGEADWSPKSVTGYTYKLDAANDIPTIVEANAGAGVWTVKK